MWRSCDSSCRTRNSSPIGGVLRIAERQRADALGRGQVALEQHRRHAEHVGVVVEAGARIVRRQQRRDVDVEREQIANRVGVLGAIQPMHQRAARDSASLRAARSSDAFERRDQRPLRRPRPAAARRPAASCRRAPCGSPSPRRRRCAATSARSAASSARPAGLQPLVVAGDAVLVDDRTIGGGNVR